ncbi:hypothetical protein SYNGFB01_03110 [Synechococcus sp. GFB01]|nr:hypothetical protein SYNGFB01_03110 [Synechococcus sp. GFB01]
MALGPLQRRWPPDPHRVRALLLVRDLHSPLPALVESLLQQGLYPNHILLLDSGSTSPACLSTLAVLEQRGCQWIRLAPEDQRFGPYAPWLTPRLRQQIRSWRYPYLVSDPDLAIPTTIPSDWLVRLFSALNQHRCVLKVALPLDVSTITVQNSSAIRAHEEGLSRHPPTGCCHACCWETILMPWFAPPIPPWPCIGRHGTSQHSRFASLPATP